MKGKLDREGKRNHKPDFIETETHFYVPIISIKEIKEESEFYDLCIKGSHSFVANGLVCHNTVTEAAACKKPIISPYNTSLMEMSNHGSRWFTLAESYPFCGHNDNVIREQSSIYEIAETIVKVAQMKQSNSEELKKKIESAYSWTKTIEWDMIGDKFADEFKMF